MSLGKALHYAIKVLGYDFFNHPYCTCFDHITERQSKPARQKRK